MPPLVWIDTLNEFQDAAFHCYPEIIDKGALPCVEVIQLMTEHPRLNDIFPFCCRGLSIRRVYTFNQCEMCRREDLSDSPSRVVPSPACIVEYTAVQPLFFREFLYCHPVSSVLLDECRSRRQALFGGSVSVYHVRPVMSEWFLRVGRQSFYNFEECVNPILRAWADRPLKAINDAVHRYEATVPMTRCFPEFHTVRNNRDSP